MVGSSGAGPHRVHRKEAFPADDDSEGWSLLNGRNLLRGKALGGHVRGTDAAGLDSTVRQCDTGEHWGALGSTGES